MKVDADASPQPTPEAVTECYAKIIIKKDFSQVTSSITVPSVLNDPSFFTDSIAQKSEKSTPSAKKSHNIDTEAAEQAAREAAKVEQFLNQQALENAAESSESTENAPEIAKEAKAMFMSLVSDTLRAKAFGVKNISDNISGANIIIDTAKQMLEYLRTGKAGRLEMDELSKLIKMMNEALIKGEVSQNEAKGESGTKRYNLSQTKRYTKYNEPITLADVEVLRSIGRKSINKFTSNDLKKAQKWPYKFYQALGPKSPFFRAWFGEWRAHDISPAEIVKFAYGETPPLNKERRKVYNNDLERDVTIDDDVFEDSIHYAMQNGDKKPITKLLGKIDEILAKGILLDTQVSSTNKGNKKGSTQFMHYLYTPVSVNGAPFIAKLTLEEYDLTSQTRSYNLQKIEMSDLSRAQFSKIVDENRGKYAYKSDSLSVAQLYEFVKSKDENFVAAPEVSEYVLNDDGTPKVFYHGSDELFTTFGYDKIGSATGVGILICTPKVRRFWRCIFLWVKQDEKTGDTRQNLRCVL